MIPTRRPTSTYRLQLNGGFTFNDARAIVDYLDALGIGDVYASSYLAAVPGSPHGYDVADPTRLNPDIGTDADHAAWMDAMHARGMGHVIDVVPNHMGIAKSSNPWWRDLLENGPSSRFARFFDIEWHPIKDELADKVLIPVLGDQYGEVLERQELMLAFRDGAFTVHYYDEALPIAPDTYPMVFADDLPQWLVDHPGDESDELQSILTAAAHLPSRSSRAADEIATRSREKEIVKRRLADLSARSDSVRTLIASAVTRLNGVAGQPRTFDALDRLLNAQSYRVAHWRVASEEINYRRFFDINQLAALRMEDPLVFDEVHRLVFDLVGRGAATGLRIDHVDGLFAPGDYLQRLQERLPGPSFFIVVEKILATGEQLPREWPIAGTTGYEFASVVNNLFVDRRNEKALDEIYRRFTRDRRGPQTFADLAYRSKKEILHQTMSGDINSLGHQLNRFSERNRHFRDFTLYNLISTIKEIIACFPVYRTYINERDAVSDHDRRYVAEAVACAKERAGGMTSLAFDFIERLLLKKTGGSSPDAIDERSKFIGKFQQITSPVAAKGIEDTALYVYNRLLSLNEVGSDPMVFGLEPADVHAWMAERQQRWPAALSATATHDTKRGEDVRARLNVLSEIPGAWKAAVSKWRTVNRRYKTDVDGLAPDPNEEYLIYQTLVGAWPFDEDPHFLQRILDYIRKALRESKVHTSWVNPDETYEHAVFRFVTAILERRRTNMFLQSFVPFQQRVAELGMYNSLAQLLIKISAPGVPDFYQGTEFWDLNLVDPDNRRPVDYAKRRTVLAALKGCATPPAECARDLLEHRRDGRVKMFVAARALEARREFTPLFERGTYVPLPATGSRRECAFAFARVLDGSAVITVAPRMVATLIPDATTPPIGSVWGDTRIDLSPMAMQSPATWRNAFTGETMDAHGDLDVATLLGRFPVAMLVPCSG
ncbi:MAG TPA: malto-oligosyltrehalose synthase [Vicinamibacterales bacterium]|nr:malto-oligosyltrehalose synthase [Vicinamibacterales bacterium]